jgi:hypothetical protein
MGGQPLEKNPLHRRPALHEKQSVVHREDLIGTEHRSQMTRRGQSARPARVHTFGKEPRDFLRLGQRRGHGSLPGRLAGERIWFFHDGRTFLRSVGRESRQICQAPRIRREVAGQTCLRFRRRSPGEMGYALAAVPTAWSGSAQGRRQRIPQQSLHESRLPEADFPFGRVDIDVEIPGLQIEKQDTSRMGAAFDQPGVGIRHRRAQDGTFHRPPVHKKVDHPPRRTRESGGLHMPSTFPRLVAISTSSNFLPSSLPRSSRARPRKS